MASESDYGPLPSQESALGLPEELEAARIEGEISRTKDFDTLADLERQRGDFWETRAHIHAGRLEQLERRVAAMYRIASKSPNMHASTLLALFEVTP